MNFKIITNNNYKNLLSTYKELEANIEINEIFIASAFFSNDKLIIDWANRGRKIKLLVSLRPPTNYYSLKNIYSNKNIEVKFLGKEFHSKFIIFKNSGIVIGSSNFTNNGIIENLETNFSSTDSVIEKKMQENFTFLWSKANHLEPSDLSEYENIYNIFLNRRMDKELEDFENKIMKNRNNYKMNSISIAEEAKKYLQYWKYIDLIKDIVKEVSENEYPDVPVYLTIDHFWHWIKTVWGKENSSMKQPDINQIKRMFSKYCIWDKTGNNDTLRFYQTSVDVFQNYLSREKINELTTESAKLVYRNLHSGQNRTTRFNSDEEFVRRNDIEKIIKSLSYLLYSLDDIDIKISNLLKNDDYKLDELKESGIQEIIGWVHPGKYPIRNKKSNDAIAMLGYEI